MIAAIAHLSRWAITAIMPDMKGTVMVSYCLHIRLFRKGRYADHEFDQVESRGPGDVIECSSFDDAFAMKNALEKTWDKGTHRECSICVVTNGPTYKRLIVPLADIQRIVEEHKNSMDFVEPEHSMDMVKPKLSLKDRMASKSPIDDKVF